MKTLPITLTGCRPTPVGLELLDAVTFQQWENIGEALAQMTDGVTWWVGDWIAFGERRFADKIETAQVLTGFSYKTLYNANYVSTNVPISLRREKLSWQHHAEVAALDFVGQQKWLALAERHEMTTRRLRASIRAGRPLTKEECNIGAKSGGIISLTALAVKLRLWQKRAPDIAAMSMDELTQAHENLKPFVETDARIQNRLRELHGAR